MKYLSGQIAYNTGEPGAGGGGEGTGTSDVLNSDGTGGGAAHPEAPWGGEGVWNLGEGEAAKPWYSAIPEPEARAHIEAKGYKNPAELALANYSLTKMQREGTEGMVELPGADATDEAKNEFYSKLGRPEEPKGYEFKFGDDVKVDDNMMDFGRNTFHKAGLTPEQAQIVADDWNKFAAEQQQGMEGTSAEANEQEVAALQQRWGADLDANKAAGTRVLQSLLKDNPELSSVVDKVDQQIGSAAVIELLAAIGKKSGEQGFTDGGRADPNDPATMTKEQAASKLSQLQGDEDYKKKYWDKDHPEHNQTVKLTMALMAKAG